MAKLLIRDVLRQNWFIVGVLLTVASAAVYPRMGAIDGPLRPELTSKYAAAWVVFFASGSTLTPGDLGKMAARVKVTCFVQATSLLVMPLLFTALAAALTWGEVTDPWVLKGFVVLACMPPPAAYAVVLTKTAGGNHAGAVFNAVVANLLAVVVAPFTLYLFLGSSTFVPLRPALESVCACVLAPLLAGSLLRSCLVPGARYRRRADTIAQCATLYVVYVAFCQTFLHHDLVIAASTLIFTVFAVVGLQIAWMSLVFYAASHVKDFDRSDLVAILFCCSTKSLSLGVPMLRVLYSGYAHLSAVTLPLLVYHPTQVILGGLAAERLRRWAAKADPRWRSRLTA